MPLKKIKISARKLRNGGGMSRKKTLLSLPLYIAKALVVFLLNLLPQTKKRKHYVHYIHEHRRTTVTLMPMQQLTRKAAILSVSILVITSVTPGGVFDSHAADGFGAPFLSEEDIAFNLEQLITTEEGFLVKNMPQDAESIRIDRIDTISHEVQEGQTISQIAELYEIKTDTLIWENNIVSVDTVKPGQVLKIPPTDGISHEVSRGDTISTIVAKYDVDESALRKYNSLATDRLAVGQNLFIPGGKRVTETLVAQNEQIIAPPQQVQEVPTQIASVPTDINANIEPNLPEPTPPTPDSVPTPNIAPLTGVTGTQRVTSDNIDVPKQQIQAPAQAAGPASSEQGNSDPKIPSIKPTIGQVSQGYRRGHYALDIANRSRPDIYASGEGVIVQADYGWNGGYGNVIVIDHGNGYQTLYAHNEVLYVSVGQSVKRGQVISKMGNTGRVYGATGIHLHYECHLNGVRINPYQCM
jgi:murein DD-endopeptidase MepM/ murein hydrolase activator NlpD